MVPINSVYLFHYSNAKSVIRKLEKFSSIFLLCVWPAYVCDKRDWNMFRSSAGGFLEVSPTSSRAAKLWEDQIACGEAVPALGLGQLGGGHGNTFAKVHESWI